MITRPPAALQHHLACAQRQHVRMPHGTILVTHAAGWTGTIKLGNSKNKKHKSEDAAGKQRDAPAVSPAHGGPVLASHDLPSFIRPWNAGPLLSSCSSGLVVNAQQGLVLTTAGAVHYAPYDDDLDACVVNVRVASSGASSQPARVVAVAQDADLALLALVDPAAARPKGGPPLCAVSWSKHPPVPGSPVLAAGFSSVGQHSAGGSGAGDASGGVPLQLVVTRGVVSRVEVGQTSHAHASLPVLQVDAAVHAGAWGGGLFDISGRCVGVLLQRSSMESWRARYSPPDRSLEAATYGSGATVGSGGADELLEELQELRQPLTAAGPVTCAATTTGSNRQAAACGRPRRVSHNTSKHAWQEAPADCMPAHISDSERLGSHAHASTSRSAAPAARQGHARGRMRLWHTCATTSQASEPLSGPAPDVENVAHVIPASVVARFLQDLRRNRGMYAGVPQPHFTWQPLSSRLVAHVCGIAAADTAAASTGFPGSTGVRLGVRVLELLQPWTGQQGLQPGDVVIAIDGTPVATDGRVTVPEQAGTRLPFTYLLAARHVGERVTYTVVREGQVLEITHSLQPYTTLVPAWPGIVHETVAGSYGLATAAFRYPQYAFCGPLAFTALSQQLLAHLCGSDAAARTRPTPVHAPYRLPPRPLRRPQHGVQRNKRPAAMSLQLQLLLCAAHGHQAYMQLCGQDRGDTAASALREDPGDGGAGAEMELVVLLPDSPPSVAAPTSSAGGHDLPPGPHLLLTVCGTQVRNMRHAEELWCAVAAARKDVRLEFAGGWVAVVPWQATTS